MLVYYLDSERVHTYILFMSRHYSIWMPNTAVITFDIGITYNKL